MAKFLVQPEVNTSIDGIITKLNNDYPSNWNRFVKVKPSTTYNNANLERINYILNRSISDDTSIYNWCSDQIPNSSFVLSFPEFWIVPSFYTFYFNTVNRYYTVSWKIEGSKDMNKWALLAEENDRDELKNQPVMKTFAFQKQGVFKHFRITQTKGFKDDNPDDIFCVRMFELFGDVLKKLPFCSNMKASRYTNSYCVYYVIAIIYKI